MLSIPLLASLALSLMTSKGQVGGDQVLCWQRRELYFVHMTVADVVTFHLEELGAMAGEAEDTEFEGGAEVRPPGGSSTFWFWLS